MGAIVTVLKAAQPGDQTTNPGNGIVMPERYASSQRVDSLARVVITPVRHTHTRLHIRYCKYVLHLKTSTPSLYGTGKIGLRSYDFRNENSNAEVLE